jgi:hypothetical protein
LFAIITQENNTGSFRIYYNNKKLVVSFNRMERLHRQKWINKITKENFIVQKEMINKITRESFIVSWQ